MIDEQTRKVVEQILPHNCTTCGWMQPNQVPPLKGQKFCKYPGRLEVKGSSCLMWKLEEDVTRRSVGGNWVEVDLP